MKQIASGRIARAAVTYGENAPMATACCNVCRTCVTTNIVGIVMAAVAASGMEIRRLLRRPGNDA